LVVLGVSYTIWFRGIPGKPVAVYSDDTIYVIRGKPDSIGKIRISNTGSEPLEIKAIQQSCSCVKATISKSIVPTKGEAILEAKVQGEIDGSIFVLTNDLEHCEQVIRVIIIPEGMIECKPQSLDFGVLIANSTEEVFSTTILRLNPEFWPVAADRVLSVQSNHPSLRVETKWLNEIDVKVIATLTTEVEPLRDSNVTVTRTDDPSFEFRIPVVGTAIKIPFSVPLQDHQISSK
jgi:hypothetical protein